MLGVIINILILIIGIYITYYILTAIMLNKYSKMAYGKGSVLAWVPILRLYLYGKYAFNEVIGVLLFFAFILFDVSFTLRLRDGSIFVYPPYILPYANYITSLAIFAAFVITIINYFKLKNGEIPNSLKNERMKKSENNVVKPEKQIVENNKTIPSETTNVSINEVNPITNENKQQLENLTELKSNEVYDASNAAIEAKLHKNEFIEQPTIQVEKVNCPNCGVLINKDIKVCPFCGKENI